MNGRSSISMPTSLVSHIFSYTYTDVHLAMFRGETEKAETYWKKLLGTIKHNEAGNEYVVHKIIIHALSLSLHADVKEVGVY